MFYAQQIRYHHHQCLSAMERVRLTWALYLLGSLVALKRECGDLFSLQKHTSIVAVR